MQALQRQSPLGHAPEGAGVGFGVGAGAGLGVGVGAGGLGDGGRGLGGGGLGGLTAMVGGGEVRAKGLGLTDGGLPACVTNTGQATTHRRERQARPGWRDSNQSLLCTDEHLAQYEPNTHRHCRLSVT